MRLYAGGKSVCKVKKIIQKLGPQSDPPKKVYVCMVAYAAGQHTQISNSMGLSTFVIEFRQHLLTIQIRGEHVSVCA